MDNNQTKPERSPAQVAASYIRQVEGMRVSLLFIQDRFNIPTDPVERALETVSDMLRDWIRKNNR